MRFRFDANQEYQLQAIEAITDLFVEQPPVRHGLRAVANIMAVPNRLDLDEDTLLANLQAVQLRSGITPDSELTCIEDTIGSAGGSVPARFYNFSVEMETGTGKTYVYLRTALELHRRYGFRKYIIVVPSIAIREGVLKMLQMTEEHFAELYGNMPYRYEAYDSANLTQVRQFALSSSVEFMVMTLAAFNKATNLIYQATDRLQGEMPAHMVQATCPILILDEPQNMESEKSVTALTVLNPLFALRYSATHRNPYNVVYRLTPFEAYRQGLVKRIEVDAVCREEDTLQPYLRLVSIKAKKRTLTARIAVHKLVKGGAIKERTITARPGDSLEDKTGRDDYRGYEVDEINAGFGFVRFANNVEISKGEELGAEKGAVFETQIRRTIETHFRKQRRLRPAGIKVLTLFFIDRVDNYAGGGLIRQLFDRIFDELKQEYPEWRGKTSASVQAAYFAQRRTRSGEVILQDSKTGEAARDRDAYDLIMKDKERLLSFDEPVAFIFSHSALREGWDNPNVFQICTLNQTISEMKKRQEVGRGVRLAVNQAGERIHDERVSILTVVANESYERYVRQLQSEIAFEYREEIEARYGKSLADLSAEERAAIETEYGSGILPPLPADARKRGVARLNKARQLDEDFKALWEKIKHKTHYAVKVDTDRLIREVAEVLERMEIEPPRITVTKARVEVGVENVFEALQMSASRTASHLNGKHPLPNLVKVMSDLMRYTSPPIRLTRQTLLEIIKRAPDKDAIVRNPHAFATAVVRIIKEKLVDQLVAGIQYERINEWYEMTQFEGEIQAWQEHLVPASKSLYDHVIFDSDIECAFVDGLEAREDVVLYVKLPGWFTVMTPIGEYNPDWAIVMRGTDHLGEPTEEKLYLVRETKGTFDRTQWRLDEQRKVKCGGRHFEAIGVDYRVAVETGELP